MSIDRHSPAASATVIGPAVSLRRDRPLALSAIVSFAVLAEFVIVGLTSFAASLGYHWAMFHQWPPGFRYMSTSLILAFFFTLLSLAFRHFNAIQSKPRPTFLLTGFGAVVLSFSFLVSLLFIMKVSDAYSRATFIFQFISVTVAIIGSRSCFYYWLARALASGRVASRRSVLIGDKAELAKYTSQLRTAGVRVLNVISMPNLDEESGRTDQIRDIVDVCRTAQPDEVVIFSRAPHVSATLALSRALSNVPFVVQVVPLDTLDLMPSSRLVEVAGAVAIEVAHPPLSRFDQTIKRMFDIAVASVGLVMIAPLMLLVALVIKLDSRGPVLFRQIRHGYNYKNIRIFKFRSMYFDADDTGFVQAQKNDARITRVGRILRRTNLDELPQLFNVLAGDMSIVGPRPHATAHNAEFEDLIPPYARRHNVKPGITGWAQVNGFRGVTDSLEKMQRRVECDLYYIDHWSLAFDIQIAFLTLFSKRAYWNAY